MKMNESSRRKRKPKASSSGVGYQEISDLDGCTRRTIGKVGGDLHENAPFAIEESEDAFNDQAQEVPVSVVDISTLTFDDDDNEIVCIGSRDTNCDNHRTADLCNLSLNTDRQRDLDFSHSSFRITNSSNSNNIFIKRECISDESDCDEGNLSPEQYETDVDSTSSLIKDMLGQCSMASHEEESPLSNLGTTVTSEFNVSPGQHKKDPVITKPCYIKCEKLENLMPNIGRFNARNSSVKLLRSFLGKPSKQSCSNKKIQRTPKVALSAGSLPKVEVLQSTSQLHQRLNTVPTLESSLNKMSFVKILPSMQNHSQFQTEKLILPGNVAHQWPSYVIRSVPDLKLSFLVPVQQCVNKVEVQSAASEKPIFLSPTIKQTNLTNSAVLVNHKVQLNENSAKNTSNVLAVKNTVGVGPNISCSAEVSKESDTGIPNLASLESISQSHKQVNSATLFPCEQKLPNNFKQTSISHCKNSKVEMLEAKNLPSCNVRLVKIDESHSLSTSEKLHNANTPPEVSERLSDIADASTKKISSVVDQTSDKFDIVEQTVSNIFHGSNMNFMIKESGFHEPEPVVTNVELKKDLVSKRLTVDLCSDQSVNVLCKGDETPVSDSSFELAGSKNESEVAFNNSENSVCNTTETCARKEISNLEQCASEKEAVDYLSNLSTLEFLKICSDVMHNSLEGSISDADVEAVENTEKQEVVNLAQCSSEKEVVDCLSNLSTNELLKICSEVMTNSTEGNGNSMVDEMPSVNLGRLSCNEESDDIVTDSKSESKSIETDEFHSTSIVTKEDSNAISDHDESSVTESDDDQGVEEGEFSPSNPQQGSDNALSSEGFGTKQKNDFEVKSVFEKEMWDALFNNADTIYESDELDVCGLPADENSSSKIVLADTSSTHAQENLVETTDPYDSSRQGENIGTKSKSKGRKQKRSVESSSEKATKILENSTILKNFDSASSFSSSIKDSQHGHRTQSSRKKGEQPLFEEDSHLCKTVDRHEEIATVEQKGAKGKILSSTPSKMITRNSAKKAASGSSPVNENSGEFHSKKENIVRSDGVIIGATLPTSQSENSVESSAILCQSVTTKDTPLNNSESEEITSPHTSSQNFTMPQCRPVEENSCEEDVLGTAQSKKVENEIPVVQECSETDTCSSSDEVKNEYDAEIDHIDKNLQDSTHSVQKGKESVSNISEIDESVLSPSPSEKCESSIADINLSSNMGTNEEKVPMEVGSAKDEICISGRSSVVDGKSRDEETSSVKKINFAEGTTSSENNLVAEESIPHEDNSENCNAKDGALNINSSDFLHPANQESSHVAKYALNEDSALACNENAEESDTEEEQEAASASESSAKNCDIEKLSIFQHESSQRDTAIGDNKNYKMSGTEDSEENAPASESVAKNCRIEEPVLPEPCATSHRQKSPYSGHRKRKRRKSFENGNLPNSAEGKSKFNVEQDITVEKFHISTGDENSEKENLAGILPVNEILSDSVHNTENGKEEYLAKNNFIPDEEVLPGTSSTREGGVEIKPVDIKSVSSNTPEENNSTVMNDIVTSEEHFLENSETEESNHPLSRKTRRTSYRSGHSKRNVNLRNSHVPANDSVVSSEDCVDDNSSSRKSDMAHVPESIATEESVTGNLETKDSHKNINCNRNSMVIRKRGRPRKYAVDNSHLSVNVSADEKVTEQKGTGDVVCCNSEIVSETKDSQKSIHHDNNSSVRRKRGRPRKYAVDDRNLSVNVNVDENVTEQKGTDHEIRCSSEGVIPEGSKGKKGNAETAVINEVFRSNSPDAKQKSRSVNRNLKRLQKDVMGKNVAVVNEGEISTCWSLRRRSQPSESFKRSLRNKKVSKKNSISKSGEETDSETTDLYIEGNDEQDTVISVVRKTKFNKLKHSEMNTGTRTSNCDGGSTSSESDTDIEINVIDVNEDQESRKSHRTRPPLPFVPNTENKKGVCQISGTKIVSPLKIIKEKGKEEGLKSEAKPAYRVEISPEESTENLVTLSNYSGKRSSRRCKSGSRRIQFNMEQTPEAASEKPSPCLPSDENEKQAESNDDCPPSEVVVQESTEMSPDDTMKSATTEMKQSVSEDSVLEEGRESPEICEVPVKSSGQESPEICEVPVKSSGQESPEICEVPVKSSGQELPEICEVPVESSGQESPEICEAPMESSGQETEKGVGEDSLREADQESSKMSVEASVDSPKSESKEEASEENVHKTDEESSKISVKASASSTRSKRKRSQSLGNESQEPALEVSANSSKSKRKKSVGEDKVPANEGSSELACSLLNPPLSSTSKAADQPVPKLQNRELEVTIKVEVDSEPEDSTPVRYSSSGRKISRKSFSDELYTTPDLALKSSQLKEEKPSVQYSSSGRKISKKNFGDDVHTPPIAATTTPVTLKSVKSDKKKSFGGDSDKKKSFGGGSDKKRSFGGDITKPFSSGWMREVVYRATNDSPQAGKRKADIYYFTPEGTKLRSMPEIGAYLTKNKITNLQISNFTFLKEAVYREPFEKERDAKIKYASPAPGPSKPKKEIKKEVSTESKSVPVTEEKKEEKRVPKLKLPFTFPSPVKSSHKTASPKEEKEKPKEQMKRPASKQTGSNQNVVSKRKKGEPAGLAEKRKVTHHTRKSQRRKKPSRLTK